MTKVIDLVTLASTVPTPVKELTVALATAKHDELIFWADGEEDTRFFIGDHEHVIAQFFSLADAYRIIKLIKKE